MMMVLGQCEAHAQSLPRLVRAVKSEPSRVAAFPHQSAGMRQGASGRVVLQMRPSVGSTVTSCWAR